MKKLLVIGCVWAAGALAARGAEENFTRTVRAEDFAAAGLAKLTPAELARLDALVRDFGSGALVAARAAAEAAEARAAQAVAETQAAEAKAMAAAKPKKSGAGLLARARDVFAPEPKGDEPVMESRLKGEFNGWEGRVIFTLENGTRWRVANAASYYCPAIASPQVRITPAGMGGFWMTVVEAKARVKVLRLD